jgi:hypothetical protein
MTNESIANDWLEEAVKKQINDAVVVTVRAESGQQACMPVEL